ncbi:MAG: DUF4230 domain-containing protein [Flavobacteriaceae bacterium]|nr:DUF4230 domain-containing protein [Flavobacteriaceae bacterium]
MKKIAKYILVFFIGILVALGYFKKETQQNKKEQIQVLLNEIKNVSKLIVTEINVSEIYNYQSANKYFFEMLSFNKKIILVVNAKVQVSYDLSKMDVVTDSINKKIIIKSIPKAEVFIAPEVQYYDFEQSTFNSFTKEELNKINKKSIEKITETTDLSIIKIKAKKQLLLELGKLYNMATLLNWELIDETENQLIITNFKN